MKLSLAVPFLAVPFLVVALALAAASACSGADSELDDTRFVPVDEVRRGDRCIARTVFAGTEIEEFELEILSVVRGVLPGSDLIIGRAESELLERTGILEGMSGSPVYRDGRLLGAIASTWAFSKEPIAGITPIGEMLPALGMLDSEPGERSGEGPVRPPGLDLMPEGERASSPLSRVADLCGLGPSLSPPAPLGPAGEFGSRELLPIAAPLVVAGVDPRYLDSVAGALDVARMTPVPVAAAGAAGAADLEPGSAVGIQFVRGDASWTAIGTVTLRDGDDILAFGHPLFNAGAVEMPLVSAYVHTVLPLQSVSFKYASGGELLGTIRQDRHRMVAGRLGPPPRMMPVGVNVGGTRGERRYDFEVVQSRTYASYFAGLALGGAVSAGAKSSGPATVDLVARVDVGGETAEYRNVFHSTEPAARCGGELSLLLSILQSNAFEDRELVNVEVDVTLLEIESWTVIERVDADRAFYEPGDDVRLRVILRPLRGEPEERTIVLRVPSSAPDGALTVFVGGAEAFHQWDAERLGPGLAPRSFAQLVELIEGSRPGNVVVAQMLSDAPGFSLSGNEVRGVPGRVGLAMAAGATSGAVDAALQSVLSEGELELDGAVVGFHELTIGIKAED